MSAPPNALDTLLLRAATADGASAIAAWEAWREVVDFDALKGEAVRLVPMLYRNLARVGVDAAATARYANVYRHNWATNRFVFKSSARTLRQLHAAGIDTLLLKGAALTLLHYRDAGARTMADVDVLVPPARVHDAVAILKADGWKSDISPAWIATRHSKDFHDERRRVIDLHWYASADARTPEADAPFWEAAVPVVIEGVATRALAPTDLLYNVLAHGYASVAPHVRWAADAAIVMRAAPATIDWERLIALAETRRLVLPVLASLSWLRVALGAPVPDEVLERLSAAKVPLVDRIEHADARSERPFARRKVMLRLWCWYRRSTNARGVALALGFARWLAAYNRSRDVTELRALDGRGANPGPSA